MRFLIAALTLSLIVPAAVGQEQVEKKETQKEIQKLLKLKKEVEALLEEKRQLLKKIEEEKKALEKAREEFRKEVEKARSERYKKLAQIFSKMDPEMAGQKISAMTDPKEAAFIIYNMKSRTAGEVMNYVDPKMVDRIVQILTKLRASSPSDGKSSQGS